MITEQDLLEAIAECQGQRNPNANTCIKLAAYYTILNNLQSTSEENSVVSKHAIPPHSYDSPDNAETTVNYHSDSEFSKLIDSKSAKKMWAIVDELMSALMYLNPKLYNDAMNKFSE